MSPWFKSPYAYRNYPKTSEDDDTLQHSKFPPERAVRYGLASVRHSSFGSKPAYKPIFLLPKGFHLFCPEVENDISYQEEQDLRLLAANDEQAFRRIYDCYSGKVFSIAYVYLKSNIHAQDIVQDVFLKVWTKRGELKELENFGGWLKLVTRNLVIDGLRKNAREDKLLSQQKEGLGVVTGEEQLIRKQMAATIRAGIDQLSHRQKQVYLLSKEEGLSHSEIAEKLDLSPATVREHMKQALRSLRAFLKSRPGLVTLLLVNNLI